MTHETFEWAAQLFDPAQIFDKPDALTGGRGLDRGPRLAFPQEGAV